MELEKFGGNDRKDCLLKIITQYLLKKHMAIRPKHLLYFIDQLDPLLFSHQSLRLGKLKNQSDSALQSISITNAQTRIVQEFNDLSTKVLGLKDQTLPLAIESFHPAHPSFTLTEWRTTLPQADLHDCNAKKYAKKSQETATIFSTLLSLSAREDDVNVYEKERLGRMLENHADSLFVEPLDVVIALEPSKKWPKRDAHAVAAIKAAFYIKIAGCLEKQHGLFCKASPGWLDVYKAGYVFRLRIRADKEIAEGKNTSAMKKLLSFSPKHVEFVHQFQRKHRSFSGTVRLAKRWLYGQMFSNSINDETIELIVMHLFAHPFPFGSPPLSHQCGFLRFLQLLSGFDWQNQPLILDLEGKLSTSSGMQQAIMQDFEAVRGPDMLDGPPIYIISTRDLKMQKWTQQGPSIVDLRRIVALARQSLQTYRSLLTYDKRTGEPLNADCKTNYQCELSVLSQAHKWTAWRSVFLPSLSTFDVLIQLDRHLVPHHNFALEPSLKAFFPNESSSSSSSSSSSLGKRGATQLAMNTKLECGPLVGFNPVECFVAELKERFGDIALFYHDKCGGSVIGVVWKPSAFLPCNLDIKSFSSSCSIPLPDVCPFLFLLPFFFCVF